MKCSVCDTLNKDDARFCRQCGSSLSVDTCPKCKAELEPGARFCSACGERLPPQGGNAGKMCQSCGFVNPSDTVYCKRCMQKVL